MSEYEHHIFLSYARLDKRWTRWARQNVAETLETLLRPSLRDVHVFVDEQIDTGRSWPEGLARALSRSRILVPLLSRAYFESDWCKLELSLMFERERQCQLRSKVNPAVLILPFVHDDGDSFPPEVKAMQLKSIHDYSNPYVLPDSPTFERFSEFLRDQCPTILKALGEVPTFNPTWESISHEQFREKFKHQETKQTTVPTLSPLPLNKGTRFS